MLNLIILAAAMVVVSYFIGSIPFAVLMSKVFGLADPRTYGSGNPGATNVLRSGKKAAAALTLLGDAGKGWLAVIVARYFEHYDDGHFTMALAELAVFLGHVFPVFLRFKGGKGVATSLGAFLPISASAVAAAGALWLLVVLFWRYSSLGSIVAAASLPALVYVFYAPRHAPPTYMLAGTVIVSLLVLAKHQANIRRLIAGTENRLGSRR